LSAKQSLERRLVLAVVVVLALALSGFSLLLHAAFRDALVHGFDDRLEDDAQAIADMIEQHEDGTFEVEGSLPDFERTRGLGYVQAWKDDGSVLARSSALGVIELPRASAAARETTLPDGRRGRVYVTKRLPRRDVEGRQAIAVRPVIIAVARDTDEVEAAVSVLRRWLAILGASALALSSAATIVVMRRGFSPVHLLATRLSGIDERRLGQAVSAEGVPDELSPLVAKLNELLFRLEVAFARERQFTSDASHELRTPMAAIRSILEVTLSRERTPQEYRAALGDTLAVVVQANELIEQLLSLARLDAREVPVACAAVPMRALVTHSFTSMATLAKERRVSFENGIAETTTLVTDGEKLRLVVANLLANALQYANEGGIVCTRSAPEDGLVLEVRNSGPAIPDAELERIFDRFARLDASRSNGTQHAGIGLALVRSVCSVLGFRVSAANDGDGWVSFRVEMEAMGDVREAASVEIQGESP
jgi:signal transduction histidine kinase